MTGKFFSRVYVLSQSRWISLISWFILSLLSNRYDEISFFAFDSIHDWIFFFFFCNSYKPFYLLQIFLWFSDDLKFGVCVLGDMKVNGGEIDESKVKAPNMFERAKEEFDAVVGAIHQRKSSKFVFFLSV